MKQFKFYFLSFLAIGIMAFSFTSCDKEDDTPAPTVTLFASVDGYDVAFTSTVTDVDTYAWDFGDGETGTEANPVHTYAASGSFTATLTVTGEGGTAEASSVNTISASELEMLTGTEASGKTWVFSPLASEGDGIFKAVAPPEFEDPIPDGILGLVGLSEEYEDEFTFMPDGSYSHVTKNDSVVADILYCMLNGIDFRQSYEDLIVLAPFTPTAGTFTYAEDSDLTLTVVDQVDDEVTSDVTWSGVGVLEIGDGEFIGIMDFTRKYMILDITVDKIQIGIFISTSEGSNMNVPKHILIMSFIPKV